MDENPKTREELIDDLKVALESSGEDPTKVNYMLRPENLAKLSGDEIREFTGRYSDLEKRAEILENKKAKYRADFAADVETERARLRIEAHDFIQKFIDEKVKGKGGGNDKPDSPATT